MHQVQAIIKEAVNIESSAQEDENQEIELLNEIISPKDADKR